MLRRLSSSSKYLRTWKKSFQHTEEITCECESRTSCNNRLKRNIKKKMSRSLKKLISPTMLPSSFLLGPFLKNVFLSFKFLVWSVQICVSTYLMYRKDLISPSRPNPGRREKSKVNFYFHTSLWCLKRFYECLKGLHKIFWCTTKKYKNKNLT